MVRYASLRNRKPTRSIYLPELIYARCRNAIRIYEETQQFPSSVAATVTLVGTVSGRTTCCTGWMDRSCFSLARIHAEGIHQTRQQRCRMHHYFPFISQLPVPECCWLLSKGLVWIHKYRSAASASEWNSWCWWLFGIMTVDQRN